MKLTVNGRGLAYQEAGSGASVLFIHAYPLDRSMWAPQLKALSQTHRVIAPDLAGFGDSDALPGSSPEGEEPSLDAYADDLAALLDALSARPAVIVGLSMGGYIALNLFRRHRACFRALALADTRATADDDAAKESRRKTAAAEISAR